MKFLNQHDITTINGRSECNRREFLRLIGAATLPLVVASCQAEEFIDHDELDRFRSVNPEKNLSVSVMKTLNSQNIVTKPEYISIDSRMLAHLSLGDQCRIVRSNGKVALYTVAQARKESSSDHVRMGLAARKRLGTRDPFNGTLSTKVVADLTDKQAQAQDEFVERLVDDGESNAVVVLAPHGGQIELYTDQQAAHMRSLLAGKGASSWICKGYKQGGGAYDRWHVASTDLSPNSFPGLSEIEDRGFAYAVSFHGSSHSGVSIGGGAPLSLKRKIRTAIRAALVDANIHVEIADDDDGNTGASPDNVVNWLTADGEGGVQLEQSLHTRRHYGLDIATAVAEVFDDLL